MIDFDVLALDRDLQRVAQTWRRWQRALGQGGGLDWDPFVGLPDVARRSTLESVDELDDQDPLRRPLQRWVYRLTEQRMNRHELALVTRLRRRVKHEVGGPESGRYTVTELTRRFVSDPPRRAHWLEALVTVSDALNRSEGLLWERRHEIARGMHLEHADDMECPRGAVDAADRWLQVSDELLQEVGADGWPRWVQVALGDGSSEGWPARLTPRTVADLLRETTWLDRVSLDPGRLPDAVAPASFVRALHQVGQAWGEALATVRQPFVVATDPYRLRSSSFGFLFATLPLHASFVRRVLAVGAPRIRDHLRGTARTVLLATRLAAARVLLRGPALAGTSALREAYPEILRRASGVALPGHLAGVLVQLDVEDAARFMGWLAGAARRQREIEEHDEDWFRNPRAAEALRDEADLPPVTDLDDGQIDDGIGALDALLRATW